MKTNPAECTKLQEELNSGTCYTAAFTQAACHTAGSNYCPERCGSCTSLAATLRRKRFRVLASTVNDLAPGCAYFHRASMKAKKEALVQHILNHRWQLRCSMARPADIAAMEPASPHASEPPAGLPSCSGSFNNRALPFRWLPGLRLSLLPTHHYTRGGRFEVMHMFDWSDGPVWFYAAPGSGVWWDPGRVVFARNLVAAVLKFRPLQDVVSHLSSVCSSRPALLQWKLAFGNVSWEEILSEAATGTNAFSLVAQADVFAPLLTPPPDVDSVVLLQQMHVFPRWGNDYYYGVRLVNPHCGNQTSASDVPEWRALHYLPEIVDFRVRLDRRNLIAKMQRGGRNHGEEVKRKEYSNMVLEPMRSLGVISSSILGAPCVDWSRGRGTLCTSCSRNVHILCECATSPRFGATSDGRELTTLGFDAQQAQACCQALTSIASTNMSSCRQRCQSMCASRSVAVVEAKLYDREKRCSVGCHRACTSIIRFDR